MKFRSTTSLFHNTRKICGRALAATAMTVTALLPISAHAQTAPSQLAPVISALCGVIANIPGATSQAQYQQFCGGSAGGGGGAPASPVSVATLCTMAPQDPTKVACTICAGAGSACPTTAPSPSPGGGSCSGLSAPSALPSPIGGTCDPTPVTAQIVALCKMSGSDPSGVAKQICAQAGAGSGGTSPAPGGGASPQAAVVGALCSILANIPMISSDPTGQYAANCKKPAATTPAGSESSSSTSTSARSSFDAAAGGGSTSSGAFDLGLLSILFGAAGLRSRSKKRRAL